MARPGYIQSVGYPEYFFDIPTDRLPTTEALTQGTRTFLVPHDTKRAFSESWQLCADFISSDFSNDNELLWNDVKWGYFKVFALRRMGPNLFVYCKKEPTATTETER